MKTKFLITANMLFLSTLAIAQNYYTLQPTVSTYEHLTNAIKLNAPDTIMEDNYGSDDMEFSVYGVNANFNEDNTVPSLGAYITSAGYLAVYESPAYAHTIVFHVAYSAYHRRDSTSSISIKHEGAHPGGILKIEWRNMGITGKPDSNYVNFQVWFDQGSGTLSYHYGPSQITGSFSPIIGLMRAPNNFSTITHSTYLQGQTDNPFSLTLNSPDSFVNIGSVDGFPPDGTVYSFAKTPVGMKELHASAVHFTAYPNPAHNALQVHCRPGTSFTMYNELGQACTISQKIINEDLTSLDLSTLKPGVYLLTGVSGGNASTKKILVQ